MKNTKTIKSKKASSHRSNGKNVRKNGGAAADPDFDEKEFLKKISKMTEAERRKEIGRLSVELINGEE